MRIATLIVGLLLGLLLTIQTLAVTTFGDDSATSSAAGAGLIMMLLWLFGCALVMAFPLVSAVLFGLAALIGLTASTGNFEDIRFHGGVAFVLMGMALLGYRSKRNEDRERDIERKRQAERDTMVARMLDASQQPHAAMRVCRSCGAQNPLNTRFCGDCGANLQTPQVSTG